MINKRQIKSKHLQTHKDKICHLLTNNLSFNIFSSQKYKYENTFCCSRQKGFLYLIEILFVVIIFLSFIIAYTTSNTKIDNTKLINYYKVQDIFVVSVAKQLNANEIEQLINYYLPNSNYVVDNIIGSTTNKKDCYARTLKIWKGFPVQKETIFVKICF